MTAQYIFQLEVLVGYPICFRAEFLVDCPIILFGLQTIDFKLGVNYLKYIDT